MTLQCPVSTRSSDGPRLTTATLYSSLEPCAKRASRPRPCAQLIKGSGLHRVVTAWSEPDAFVTDAEGNEILEEADVTVVPLTEYVNAAQAPTQYLLRHPRAGQRHTFPLMTGH
ncbi:hypothetical protein ABWJ92_25895 [Streptomyces sp. NPDC000609]|uniref:hypothetical protein n=1 Tax=Streptomyces sp. NPDC000609 TaxID=3160957 RepID=UPI0033995312